MKMSCNSLLSLNTIFLMLLELLTCESTCEDWPRSFTKDKKVPTLSWKDIISNHSVRGELECAFNCGMEKTCVGFKYKQYMIVGAMSPTVNCQLTNTTGRNDIANYDDKGWVFFYDEAAKELSLSNSTTEKEMSTTSTTAVLFQECFGYTWLNESSRNKKYSVLGSKCDGSLSGWYRFGGGAGIKIATSCPSYRRCGTVRSGWMKDSHPTIVKSKVTRKVCYRSHNNCSRWSNNIEVVNCGQYYVYKLSPPPDCNLRYCGSNN